MVFDFAEVLLLGLLADWLFRLCRIPGLVGMMLVGLLLGPNLLGVISPGLLDIGVELRLLALVVLLLRAGLRLDRGALNRVGARAMMLAFVPALCEGALITLIAPSLLGLDYQAAALLGLVLSAVSLAVTVPLMLAYIERGRGARSGAPTMVLAASSIENTLVIVVFTVLLGFSLGEEGHLMHKLADIPLAILVGFLTGVALGHLVCRLFDLFNPRATKRALILIALSLALLHLDQLLGIAFPFAALPAVMAIGFIMLETRNHYAQEMASKLGKIWIFAELLLFTLLGAQIDLSITIETGLAGTALVVLGLVGRSIGVNLCLVGSDMSRGARAFVTAAYLPKATVQAAIGATPLLAMSNAGLPTKPGEIILAVSVLSIILTAPLGAWATAFIGERFLEDSGEV